MNLRILLVFSVILLSFVVVNDTFASSYTLTLTSSGSQSIDISASDGTAISSDAINVATTCRYGYNFTINTSVNDNNLYLNGDSSNNTEGTYFSPIDGTSALNATTNKWGYYYNASTAPTNTSIFSLVPTLGSPATVRTPLTTPSSSDINDNFNIYYGVSSSPTMAKGTYKMIPDTNNSNNDGTIVYTATIANECLRYTVHFDPTGTNMGTSVTGTGTVDDQTMYEGIATNLTNSYFTGPTISGTTYYFAGWNTAQDGSGTQYTKGQSVTDLSSAGSTITLYAQWTDCLPNTFCYDANVSNPNDVEGEMGDQTITSSDTSAVLYAPNFSRSNYGFAAWNTKPDGTGTNYGPNQTLDFTAGQYDAGGLKLYARWIASAGNMQNWTCPNDTNMPIGTVTALKDTRDNNVYAVAKLADGKCWMIENLRLENTASHNSDGSLAQGYGTSTTYGNFSGLADPETSHFSHRYATANSLYYSDTQVGTASIDIGTNLNPAYRFPRYNNFNTQSRQSSANYSASDNTYSYGNYYTWHAAIADTTAYYSSGDHNTTSICPAGWRIPTGNTTGEFYALNTALNAGATDSTANNNFRSYPNNFLKSGYINDSSVYSRNYYGEYWTSTSYDNQYVRFFYLNDSGVSPSNSRTYKYFGVTVRCILGS